jgi:DNA-binding MarR family transcriptional regulator
VKIARKKQLAELHGAMVDLVVQMTQPQRDDTLLRAAGIALDRALFPLLVGIGRFGPIGVVEIADRVGRDYTTVSRQVAKLVSLGLVERRPGESDRRVNEATLTERGQEMIVVLQAARERLAAPLLARWSDEDFGALVTLLRRFADDIMALPQIDDQSCAD